MKKVKKKQLARCPATSRSKDGCELQDGEYDCILVQLCTSVEVKDLVWLDRDCDSGTLDMLLSQPVMRGSIDLHHFAGTPTLIGAHNVSYWWITERETCYLGAGAVKNLAFTTSDRRYSAFQQSCLLLHNERERTELMWVRGEAHAYHNESSSRCLIHYSLVPSITRPRQDSCHCLAYRLDSLLDSSSSVYSSLCSDLDRVNDWCNCAGG